MLTKFLRTISIVQRCCSTVGREAASKRGAPQEKKSYFGIEKHLVEAEKHENFLSKESENYEEGVRYLAHMMGKDSENLSEKEIEEAVSYLFPSSLYKREARPMLLPPSRIIPKKKSLQCSMDGRPFEALYYTRFPNYYNLMNEGAELLNHLKRVEDNNIRKGRMVPKEDESWETTKKNTFWLDYSYLKSSTLESISEVQYRHFMILLKRICAHPYSHLAQEFLMRFRKNKPGEIESIELPKLQKDEATGRQYVTSYGQRKMAFAEVRVYRPGIGELSVNDDRFLHAFPALSDREQVITPLVFTGLLGKVDVELKVRGNTKSSMSGAARLGIARALTCFLDDDNIRRLRLAGLLTMDMRFREKKKSGMPKARKTYIWKRR